ncbi:MAG TPA: ABC transporter ATP-binding protein [Acidimicrobiales bacterium]|nr:ABC transporter ATP-binding protein [Acidimicrobiales bacterium]
MIGRLGDRLRTSWLLASWLPAAGWRPLVPVLGALVVSMVLPSALSVATGVLVAEVGSALRHGHAALPRVEAALGVLIGLLLVVQVVGTLTDPFVRYLSARIDGAARARLRQVLSGPVGISHLEEQEVRNDAHRVSRGVAGRTLGQGVGAQLTTWFNIAGAVLSSLVAAAVAPWAAAWTLVVMVFQRRQLWRQSSGYVGGLAAVSGGVREGRYWMDVAGGPVAAKEVRLFGLQDWLVERQFVTAKASRQPIFDGVDQFNKKQWVPFTTGTLAYAPPLVWLALRTAGGHMSSGRVAFVASALIAIGSIGSPGFDMFAIQSAIPAAESMRRLANLASADATHFGALRQPSAGAAGPGPSPTLRFEQVSFSYPSGSGQVLSGLDLVIPGGRSLAIVGANGAGKTTLIKLLGRLYEPTSGRITADGVDIATLEGADWRARISVIFQDFVHYDLPLADNVGLSQLGSADPELVRRALEGAAAADIAEQAPAGAATVLSRGYPGGIELSGGQWQRVALARLLYGLHSGRDVLVLDEPTANLDAEAEIELFDRLLDQAAGRTVILVSHRFSTVRRADNIAVIDGGRLVEYGTHAELLARGGLYADMFHTQADRYADPRPGTGDTAEAGTR